MYGLKFNNEGIKCVKRRISKGTVTGSKQPPRIFLRRLKKGSLSKGRLRMATISDLIDKFTAFTAELKTRNEIDKELMKENLAREKSSTNERRFLIGVVCVLAGIDIGKLVGWF